MIIAFSFFSPLVMAVSSHSTIFNIFPIIWQFFWIKFIFISLSFIICVINIFNLKNFIIYRNQRTNHSILFLFTFPPTKTTKINGITIEKATTIKGRGRGFKSRPRLHNVTKKFFWNNKWIKTFKNTKPKIVVNYILMQEDSPWLV
ncbi:MAG: hypothetical protein CW691_03660 [Candidatus Bathyarchaeum sp.]|nr:MAG: hypothetical protein CW691_03660 [Candidatus Bathyarchaeum sp.]